MINILKHLFIVLVLTHNSPLNGQNIYLSDVFPSKSYDNVEIIGQQNGFNFFLNTSSGPSFTLLRADANLKHIQKLDLKLTERKSEILYTCFEKDELLVFYSYRSRSNLCFKLNIYNADMDFKDSINLACFENSVFNPNIKVEPSEDKTSLLVYFSESSDYYQFYAFDLNARKLKWIYKWDHKLEKTNDKVLTDILIDNQTNAFLAFDDQTKASHDYSTNLTCAYLTETGMISKNYNNLSFLPFKSTWFADNKNKRFILAGTYHLEKSRKANGILYCYTDFPVLEDSLHVRIAKFSPENLTPILNKHEHPEEGIDDVEIANALLTSDGGIVMILERTKKNERYIDNRYSNFGGIPRNLTDYYFDDLLVVALKNDGNIDWISTLPKKQFSQDDDGDYSSFFMMKQRNTLRFIFNDEIKSDNTISQYILSSNGKAERKSMFNTDFRKLKIMFRYGKQISANVCLIPCAYKNKVRYLKIEF